MKQTLIILLFVIFTPYFTEAAPVISYLQKQTVSDGDSLTINGAGFGTHNLDIEWLGGTTGNIEQGVVGSPFSKSKWSTEVQSTARETPKYTDIKSHSGSKSILSALPVQSQYTSGFTYDNGSRFDSIYISYWMYFDHVDSAGQFKHWRIRPSSGYGDMNGEIMQSHWYNTNGENIQNYTMIFCDYLNYSQCYPNGSSYWNPPGSSFPKDKWVRVDIYAKGSSVDGAADGTLINTQDRQTETRFTIRDHEGNITTRLAGSEKWQYFVFENYWGNISEGTGTKEKIYFDDIYIQINNRSRVEIGDNETWENCKHREIQIPTAWSANGTSATITINQGSFAAGSSVYLFVIDGNGLPSNSKELVIGGGTSSKAVQGFQQEK